MAKCPKCEKPILNVRFKGMQSKQSFGSNSLNSIAHCCPYCDSVLSVEVDPIAVKADIVNEIVRKLRGRA